jgi:hypothetical protein
MSAIKSHLFQVTFGFAFSWVVPQHPTSCRFAQNLTEGSESQSVLACVAGTPRLPRESHGTDWSVNERIRVVEGQVAGRLFDLSRLPGDLE